jgi:imidazoleglycerol-phosphate dehydratase
VSRFATCSRVTKETSIEIRLDLDGSGSTEVSTGLPFFDHMVEQLGKHGGFDLELRAEGDLAVDAHHTVEDVGIALGECLRKALGDKVGVRRFASNLLPLDEALGEGHIVRTWPTTSSRGASRWARHRSTLSWRRSSGGRSPPRRR